MIAIAYYLLKVLVCSGLLFLYYHLVLRNKLFHQWNRFYLLLSVFISLTVPILEFEIWPWSEDPASDLKLLYVVHTADNYVAQAAVSRSGLSGDQWIVMLYSFVSAFVLVLFILALVKIYSLVRSHTVLSIDDIKFVNTEEKSAPFSFLNYVFWNKQIDLKSTTGEQIFQHELVHVREKHSFDKLFLQLVLVAYWCNPFFWLIRRELKMIHEFIADKKSVGQSDAHAFAAMILHAAYPQHYNHLANHFFHSSIKRRLTMLSKNHNPKISYLGRILALPLMAFITLAFSIKQKNAQAPNSNSIIEKSAGDYRNTDDGSNASIVTSKNAAYDTSIDNSLIIVDGKEVGTATVASKYLESLSADKIQSVTVLKGETAIAKYGQKGKDGVIEIITKPATGKNGDIEVIGYGNKRNHPSDNTEHVKVRKSADASNLLSTLQDTTLLKVSGPNQPLIIIDGKESEKKMNEINVNEVESINVLKGESAINKYGQKAKEGAIEITTKPAGKNEPVEVIGYGNQTSRQPATGLPATSENRRDTTPDKNAVFQRVEVEATFPGGVEEWRRFLARTVKATTPAENGAPNGTYTVVVEYIVHTDGSISDVKALTKHGYGMEEEATRVIKSGPKWVPAQQNGRKVAAYRKQPITFVVATR